MGTSSPHLPPGNWSQTQVICLAASAFTCWAPPWLDSRVLEVEKISLMWYTTYCGHVLFGKNKENAFFLTTSRHTPTSWHTQPYFLLNAHSEQNCNTQCGGHCFLVPPRAVAGSVLLRQSEPALCGVCQLGGHPGCSSSHLPPTFLHLPAGCNRLISALPGELKEGTSPSSPGSAARTAPTSSILQMALLNISFRLNNSICLPLS